MRRLSGTALFLGGLGLLSTGGVLAGMVLLTREEYRSREVDPVTEEEPVLIEPADLAAILDQPVPRGPPASSVPPRSRPRPRTGASQRAAPPIQSRPTGVGQVRVDHHVAEDDYIVDGEALRRAVEELDETLSPMMPRVSAALSDQPGMGLSVSLAAGTATLDRQGFTVTGLELREGIGLQVGDTIVSLNGHRVNGLSAWWILQDLVVNNRELTELRLEIYRRGARLFKTYQITWR